MCVVEYQQRRTERVAELAEGLAALRSAGPHSFGKSVESSIVDRSKAESSVAKVSHVSLDYTSSPRGSIVLMCVMQSAADLAVEGCECCCANLARKLIFAASVQSQQT